MTWADILVRLKQAQKDHKMNIRKQELTELGTHPFLLGTITPLIMCGQSTPLHVDNTQSTVYYIYTIHSVLCMYIHVRGRFMHSLSGKTLYLGGLIRLPHSYVTPFLCSLSSLDVYHRILRFRNYLVAMINKNVLPCKLHIPFYGEK